MASRKQIEANRRNAKKSTGPKTAAGKAKAARNALKHGLTSRQVVLGDEDGAMYEEVRRNLHLDLRPESQLELLLVNRIAAQQWRLARIPALEAELIEQLRCDPTGADEGLGAAWTRDAGPYGGALARLARYETAIERSLVRLLAELRKAQAERRKVEKRDGQVAAQRPPREQAGDGGTWWDKAAEAWLDVRGAGKGADAESDTLRNEADGANDTSPPGPSLGTLGTGSPANGEGEHGPGGANGRRSNGGAHGFDGAQRPDVDPATADHERWLGDV